MSCGLRLLFLFGSIHLVPKVEFSREVSMTSIYENNDPSINIQIILWQSTSLGLEEA